MKVGIPNGLLNFKYEPFFKTFFQELGAQVIESPATNKDIVDEGIKHCVDEACMPIKVFHGHVAVLKDKCDLIVVPRIMRVKEKEFICPKFCGLPEMIVNSIPNLPLITMSPFYDTNNKMLWNWAENTGKIITQDKNKIKTAFNKAKEKQKNYKTEIRDKGYKLNIAIAGHPYLTHDRFLNMNLKKKLNDMGIGVVTEESVSEADTIEQTKRLWKRPFWTFARNIYGATNYLVRNNYVEGVIYISSFACGIDSVVIELLKDSIKNFPFLILKIDEHTGEAGIQTRIEAFVDMLERRINCHESNSSAFG